MWRVNGVARIPDIVIVDAAKITDVFELEYAPRTNMVYEPDLDRLAGYMDILDTDCPVRLDNRSGAWIRNTHRLSNEVALHFVVLALRDAAAVYPEQVSEHPAVKKLGGRFRHWYGRTGGDLAQGWG